MSKRPPDHPKPTKQSGDVKPLLVNGLAVPSLCTDEAERWNSHVEVISVPRHDPRPILPEQRSHTYCLYIRYSSSRLFTSVDSPSLTGSGEKGMSSSPKTSIPPVG